MIILGKIETIIKKEIQQLIEMIEKEENIEKIKKQRRKLDFLLKKYFDKK